MKFSAAELQELTTPQGGRFYAATPAEAQKFCSTLARSHYENFPVGSLLFPEYLRDAVHAIYTFARIADDIADELDSTISTTHSGFSASERRLALLRLKNLLTGVTANNGNPIFLALDRIKKEYCLPDEPFVKLLTAFFMDCEFRQPLTEQELLFYCSHSANPVGELMLRLFGCYNPKTAEFSDNICTGLQLANFWQDISVDIQQNRITIPAEILSRFKLHHDDLFQRYSGQDSEHFAHAEQQLIACLRYVATWAESLLERGKGLLGNISSARFRLELTLTIEGGLLISQKTRLCGATIIFQRPKIKKVDGVVLLLRTIKTFFWSYLQQTE